MRERSEGAKWEVGKDSTLIGAAGEHYVMYMLLRRGFIAALAPRGAPNTDIVVTDLDGRRLCSIQVKTRQEKGSDGGWHMKPKHEQALGDSHFFCFVDLGLSSETRPTVHIIPNRIVANVLSSTHKLWLSRPGKRGQLHNDNNVRRLIPDYTKACGDQTPYRMGWLDQYREYWDLLKLRKSDPTLERSY